jgi:hypothetical protein
LSTAKRRILERWPGNRLLDEQLVVDGRNHGWRVRQKEVPAAGLVWERLVGKWFIRRLG